GPGEDRTEEGEAHGVRPPSSSSLPALRWPTQGLAVAAAVVQQGGGGGAARRQPQQQRQQGGRRHASLKAYAHEDTSVGSWMMGLEATYVEDNGLCCSSSRQGLFFGLRRRHFICLFFTSYKKLSKAELRFDIKDILHR
ncbi:hypothetical protein Taro_029017, partial [Colocasia esculenta]|nr:hypothetical protein [Colocasia esculenta]